jgi:hypothetical protein
MTVLEVAHVKAGHDLLTAAFASPGIPLYDGKLPAATTTLAMPWVLSYTSVEWEYDNPDGSINHESSTCVTTWMLNIAAVNNTAAMAVLGVIRAALLDVVPVISGRVCWPIRMVSVQPPGNNEAIGTAVLDSIAIYELKTRPA